MSNMIQQPPPSISVNGGPQAPGQGAGPPDNDGDAKTLVKKALALVQQAAAADADPIDAAGLHKIAADCANYLATQQKTEDSVMGAGPGVKMIRKAAGPSA